MCDDDNDFPKVNLPNAKYFTIHLSLGGCKEFDSFDAAITYAHSTNKKCNRTQVLACAQNKDVFVCL